MVTSECLAEDTILAFAEGRLDATAVRTLEAHTRSCPSCSELLAATLGVVHGAPRRAAVIRSAPAGGITRGTSIGRYVVLAAVGRGGMGEVFAAYDPELDRKVALKLLHTEAGTGVARGRLLREAKAIARLSHPNVVVVHDAGTFDDRVFVAMEFVEGQTVATWLAEQTRKQREILEVFLAAARGLGAAHAAGLVHRDFKPQNVMVTAAGAVRVMDFGLARAIDEEGAAGDTAPARDAHGAPARWDLTLTLTGEMLGTPLYMAPEQFQARRADAYTDQFSFCIALYQALYGSHPFPTDTFAELMAAVTDGKVLAPPAKSSVPTWLRRVLLRGLSVDPSARWASMDALIAALEHDPARARRRAVWGAVALAALIGLGFGVARAARRPASLCRSGAARIAGAWEEVSTGPRHQQVRGALLATGLGYAGETWERVATLLDGYLGRWLAMYRDSCEATQVRGEQSAEVLDLRMSCLDERLTRLRALVDVLASADRDTVTNAVDAADGLPALDRCADVKQLRSPVEPPAGAEASQRVEALRTRAATVDAFNLTGKHQQAIKLSRTLVTEARALGYRPLLAELLQRRWAVNFSLTDYHEPIADLEQAVSLALATRRDDVAADAAALLSGIVGYYQAQHQDGERWASLADALFERLGPGHDVGRSWVLQNRADMRMQASDLDAALAYQQEALVLKRRAFPRGSGDLALSINTEGEILFRRGDAAGALARNQEAGEMYRRVYGTGSPALAINLSNRGEYLVALDRVPEALVAFQDALARWESVLGPRHAFVAYALTGIGVAHWRLGRAEQAIPPLERALAIREASEPDPAQVAETRFALARALWDAGRERARALQLAAAARAAFQRPLGKDLVQGRSPERAETRAEARVETRGETTRGETTETTTKAREVAAWLAGRERG